MAISVLLVSDGLVHPNLIARLRLRQALDCAPGFRFQQVRSLEKLVGLKAAAYPAMVLYFHHKRISAAALAALEAYTRQGGGLLAIHSAAASFKQESDYTKIIGGRFVRHGPIRAYTVYPALDADPIYGGIAPFTLRDELYRHEWEAGNRVHFNVQVDGESEPLVWTRSYGQGRVAYCAAGHTASSFQQAGIRQILARSLRWLTHS